jgi:cytochrome c2
VNTVDTPWKLYARLLGLLVLLIVMVGFNIAVWGLHRHPTVPALYVPGADPQRGRVLLQQYGCGTCHTVPGIRGATGKVGPRLDRLVEQIYVAGVLPNTPENLSYWISRPRDVDPRTAMPELGVSEKDARDIAAYLYRILPQ